MTTTPDEPIENPLPREDPQADPEREWPDGGEPVLPDAEPEVEPIEPSSGALDTPSFGMSDPVGRGVTRDSTPTGHIVDAPESDDHPDTQSDFAEEGYDDRQLDATRAAAEERGDSD